MATVKLYLGHPKKNGVLRKDEVSIVAHLARNRHEWFEMPTGEKILPKNWDFKAQCAKTTAYDHVGINLYLAKFKRDLIVLEREHKDKSFLEFKSLARGQKKTLAEVFALYQFERRDLDPKTKIQDTGLLNHLLEAKADPQDPSLFHKLREYFNEREVIDSTFYKNISRLKTFFRWAKDKGLSVNPEFEKWKIQDRKVTPLAFTMEELSSLESSILPNTLSIARDYFVISCRTGLRISDLKRLDSSQVINGVLQLTTRKKVSLQGGKKVNLYFTPGSFSYPALEILERHGGKLPTVAEPVLNDNLKLACDKAGIRSIVQQEYWLNGQKYSEDKRKCDIVSLHWGKKTFITLALESGIPDKNVAELTGTTVKVIQDHYSAPSGSKVNEGFLKAMEKKSA